MTRSFNLLFPKLFGQIAFISSAVQVGSMCIFTHPLVPYLSGRRKDNCSPNLFDFVLHPDTPSILRLLIIECFET